MRKLLLIIALLFFMYHMYGIQQNKPVRTLAEDRVALSLARQECRNMPKEEAAELEKCQNVERMDNR